ncbi:two component sensor and regulator, histidine kinase response regulator [Legionella donaldsonii]|uniref:Two component sensor and regulator, histidine kinase response regulator n=1 Tax=Legionella donaldsonii TaxID=45060 RepID=A0A378J4G7_9GAMM|nr:response regulator [Legionella donaldsonii]STX42654.1 two component sensor and regulator, histidine kinase response regulator [Legionella donaldsonii]
MVIILVEDNPVNQSIMKKILESNVKNALVKVIGSGEEAVKFFNNKANLHFNLIILDGNLGSKAINGPQVAEAIVKTEIDAPIALWTDDKAMIEIMEEVFGRALPHLDKSPINKSNIINVVKSILEPTTEPTAQRRMTW